MFDKSYWQAAEFAATHPETPPETHACEAAGCDQPGLFRAPKSPQELRSFRWFCHTHIQEYNKAWNYFAGLSPTQMEHVRREDVVGWRPTWPLGRLGGKHGDNTLQMDANALRKHIWRRFFSGKEQRARNASAQAAATPHDLTPEEQQALTRLGLSWPLSLYELKNRYRALVKKHHPDALTAAGGDMTTNAKGAADELIKLINRAYAVLKKRVG